MSWSQAYNSPIVRDHLWGLSAMDASSILPWAPTLVSLGAVLVAWRAMRNSSGQAVYQQGKDAEKQKMDDVAQEAHTTAVIAEIASKFENLMADVKEEASKFRTHDLECVRDKTRLAAQMEQNTKSIEALARTVSNLERRAGYTARDRSITDTAQKLTGKA